MDLYNNGYITENGKYEIKNVSSDKRSYKETKTFYLNELDPSEPFSLRLFTFDDVI
jgi:hypothetical protein